MVPSSSLFQIINVVIPDLKIFVCIPLSAAAVVAVDSNGIKTLLANESNIFPI